ncbi:Uncharacterized protein TCM_037375 [Theobroma cacao]|uniref:Uncharacterized protein n=1 Tax=Theobroma cacao TaxID=3641 RepID=A0A061GKG4_THECC|nr:Uncharacterized protein TCM_037375 [Theobroma cacao]
MVRIPFPGKFPSLEKIENLLVKKRNETFFLRCEVFGRVIEQYCSKTSHRILCQSCICKASSRCNYYSIRTYVENYCGGIWLQ